MSTSFVFAFLLVSPPFFLPRQPAPTFLTALHPSGQLSSRPSSLTFSFLPHVLPFFTPPPVNFPSALPPFHRAVFLPFSPSRSAFPPSLQTAICSAVNGRVLCGCDVVELWSVCTATVVHFAYQPATSPCLDPAGCLAGRLDGWLTDWLLRNWGGSAKLADTHACMHTTTTTSLS